MFKCYFLLDKANAPGKGVSSFGNGHKIISPTGIIFGIRHQGNDTFLDCARHQVSPSSKVKPDDPFSQKLQVRFGPNLLWSMWSMSSNKILLFIWIPLIRVCGQFTSKSDIFFKSLIVRN